MLLGDTTQGSGRFHLSQEWLKCIACLSMLLDHIGAVLLPFHLLRVIGRLAFPVYCFLLTEGAMHTRDPVRYGARLILGMLLSEVPFDLLFYGQLTFSHQSVMVTLLLGYLGVQFTRISDSNWLRLLVWIPLAAAADLLHSDYGGSGVILIAIFALLRGRRMLPVAGILMMLLFLGMNSMKISVLGLRVPIQLFGVLALIPIWRYSGRKAGESRALQWAFYLFYPLHMLALLLLK